METKAAHNLRAAVNVAMSSDVVNDIFFQSIWSGFFSLYSIAKFSLLTPIIPTHATKKNPNRLEKTVHRVKQSTDHFVNEIEYTRCRSCRWWKEKRKKLIHQVEYMFCRRSRPAKQDFMCCWLFRCCCCGRGCHLLATMLFRWVWSLTFECNSMLHRVMR